MAATCWRGRRARWARAGAGPDGWCRSWPARWLSPARPSEPALGRHVLAHGGQQRAGASGHRAVIEAGDGQVVGNDEPSSSAPRITPSGRTSEKHRIAVGRSVEASTGRAASCASFSLLPAAWTTSDRCPLRRARRASRAAAARRVTFAARGSATTPVDPRRRQGDDGDPAVTEVDDVLGGRPRSAAVVDVDAR